MVLIAATLRWMMALENYCVSKKVHESPGCSCNATQLFLLLSAEVMQQIHSKKFTMDVAIAIAQLPPQLLVTHN